jgi:hypothetical protein
MRIRDPESFVSWIGDRGGKNALHTFDRWASGPHQLKYALFQWSTWYRALSKTGRISISFRKCLCYHTRCIKISYLKDILFKAYTFNKTCTRGSRKLARTSLKNGRPVFFTTSDYLKAVSRAWLRRTDGRVVHFLRVFFCNIFTLNRSQESWRLAWI